MINPLQQIQNYQLPVTPIQGNQRADQQMISVGQQQLAAKQRANNAQFITHVVKPGETLWGIAQQYTGNGENWRKMEGFHSDPRTLQPGTVIHIPSSQVKNVPKQSATTTGQNLMPSPVYGNTLA